MSSKNSRLFLLLFPLAAVVLLTAVLVSTYRYPTVRMPSPGERTMLAKNARLLQKLGKAYSELEDGRVNSAEQQLKEILSTDPQQPMALRLLGRLYYESRRYPEAEEVFRRLIERNDFDAAAHNNLGQALLRLNRLDDALHELQEASDLNPDSPLVHLNLSGVYSALGQPEKARKHFLEAHRRMELYREQTERKLEPALREL